MRIAQISMHSCPLARPGERDTGGMAVYILNLARSLEERGFCVDIFTRAHAVQEPEVLQVGARTRLIHIIAGPLGEPKGSLYRHLPEFTEGVRSFRERENLSYTLVHSHYWLSGSAGVDLAREWGVPHLTSFHTLAEVKNEAFPENREPPQRARAEAWVAAHADRVVAWSQDEVEALVRLYGAPRERTTIVSAGVDLDLFHLRDRAQARQRLALPPRERVLLFVGRLDPIKGADILLESLSLLESRQGVRALVVGGDQDPGEGQRLEARAAELGLDGAVRFVGSVPHEELPWYYSAADLLVVPSYHESFSMAAAEALACGTPVVAARVGGLASLVQDGVAGYLAPVGQPQALTARISQLLQDEPLRRRMAEAAPRTVAHLGWPAVTERIVALYAETLNGVEALVPCLD